MGSNPAVPTHHPTPGLGEARVTAAANTEPTTDRILTIPNLLSVLRLLGVPPFLWLLLGPHADGWALAVLMLSGFTDWLDGVLARRLNQQSRLGAMLDPAADRLYILATLVGLVLRHIIPLWLALAIVGRDLVLSASLLVLRRHGFGPYAVHYLGKAATFCLLYAFPLLLIGAHEGTLADLARPPAWALTIWGTGLYLWAGVVYLRQAAQLVRHGTGHETAAAP
ncbi:MAG: CDP-alcohol phosphatidyltransferase family protein [Actinomycetota bacterium]|nr:CDP-alcohol phosphatidyltransferase family protein [Actinomycetota bacterium]